MWIFIRQPPSILEWPHELKKTATFVKIIWQLSLKPHIKVKSVIKVFFKSSKINFGSLWYYWNVTFSSTYTISAIWDICAISVFLLKIVFYRSIHLNICQLLHGKLFFHDSLHYIYLRLLKTISTLSAERFSWPTTERFNSSIMVLLWT